MRAWLLVGLLGACGRLGFDPQAGDPGADGGGGGDGAAAAGDNCADARDLVIGQPLSNQSIATARDDYIGIFCGNGPDLVYRFTQPVSADPRELDVLATFDGSIWVTPSCPPTIIGGCQTFANSLPYQQQSNFTPGTFYIIIDSVGGSGTTFDISVR